MSLRTVECTFCKGAKEVESLEERTAQGDWVPNKMLDHDIADKWIASDPCAPLRWVTCACPVCNGSGEVDLEFTVCRIF